MNAAADIPVDAIRAASQRADVLEAIEALYNDLDAEIGAHAPTCWNRGTCCRFAEYGHRLYVTTLEAAYYLAVQSREAAASSRLQPPGPSNPRWAADLSSQSVVSALPVVSSRPAASDAMPESDICPYAHGGRCHARAARPSGCRIFYCDPAAQHWQSPLTESCLARLRELHTSLGVEYFYGDWMRILAALSDSGSEDVGR